MSIPYLASLAALLGSSAPLIRDSVRTRPIKNNAGDALAKLSEAMQQRLDANNAPDFGLKLEAVTPDTVLAPVKEKLAKDLNKSPADINLPPALAYLLKPSISGVHKQHFEVDSKGKPDYNRPPIQETIVFNPNADAAMLAHEMGHSVSSRTDVGSKIRNLRNQLQNNPKLAYALAAATGGLPLGIAVATPGDDEYNQAIAGTVALAAPTLIDEGLATKNALAMMDSAGMRATLGQRGKLAGGLLSYLAAPVAFATAGTAIGNQFDEDVPTI